MMRKKLAKYTQQPFSKMIAKESQPNGIAIKRRNQRLPGAHRQRDSLLDQNINHNDFKAGHYYVQVRDFTV